MNLKKKRVTPSANNEDTTKKDKIKNIFHAEIGGGVEKRIVIFLEN